MNQDSQETTAGASGKVKESLHTPVPWAAFTDEVANPPHTNIVAFAGGTRLVIALPGYDKHHPNIQFIVRACNSHDDLLAACKAIARDATECKMERDVPSMVDGISWDQIVALRAAIAKAEGGAA